jgi:hypothetical protein
MDDRNPLILYSDHKRMLAQCQERYDRQLRARFWYGVVSTIWPAGFAVLFAALAGFNFGLSFVQ